MKKLPENFLISLIALVLVLTGASGSAFAQFSGAGNRQGQASTATDSAGKKTNTNEWESEDAKLYYTKPFSTQQQTLDSSIHTFHRRAFSQNWWRDLGNLGSPSVNLKFEPQNTVGLSLGYHSFDALRFHIDSLRYYNTTKAYSVFRYNLGSKLEQIAEIFHTQNIKPYWNVAVNYRKINSPGYYFIQRNNHDNFYLTTNYTSPSQHYQIYGAIVLNKEQHDENGGIAADSFLTDEQYSDKKTIPVNFYNSSFPSTKRSPVSNMQRDFSVLINQAYTFGKTDTTFNEDSTQYSTKLTPRFRINHRMELGSQRYLFKDLRPDSLRYNDYFQKSFASGDSVYTRQEWFYADNRVLLNGLFGKTDNQFIFNAGVGNRVDNFATHYIVGKTEDNNISNYLIGSLSKDANGPKQWAFAANTQFFFTGAAAGNFIANATISKDLGARIGIIKVGAGQQLNNAPYKFSTYQNQYWQRQNTFNKESSTKLFAQIDNEHYKASIGFRNYLMSNYLYFNAQQLPTQSASAFSISQFWLRKLFRVGNFTLDNEILYQEPTNAAPINVPRFLGRHQLAIESFIFKHQLQIASGIEINYHSNYFANGYSPLFNQFYNQNTYFVSNKPSASVFFNFKIKRFRAYIMMDQVQQYFTNNIIISKGYVAQDAMLRFGFNWVLIN